MHRTWIKFCGIRSVEDALAAAEAGADAVGMVFHPPARRCISIETGRKIAAALPARIHRIGLFVDQPLAEVLRIVTEVSFQIVQLHGNEPANVVEAIAPTPVMKTIKFSSAVNLTEWSHPPDNLFQILLDTPGSTGGTGVENNWELIEQAQANGRFDGLKPIVLAGGLNPENVGAIVRRLRPFGVDVSSGIEAEWGKKSPERMRAFVKAVRAADAD